MYYDYNLSHDIKNKVLEYCCGEKVVKNATLDKRSISIDDIVLVESEENKKLFEGYKVISWEELIRVSENEVYQRLDYSYLRCKLDLAKQKSAKILAIGSSYMQFGLFEGVIDNCVNLSLSGMDLYYCDKIIRDVCDCNPNIKYVLIGGGYYYFHADMSRNTNNICKYIVSQALYPIFHDMHNAASVSAGNSNLPHSSIIDVDKFFMYINDIIWKGNCYDYFLPDRDRKFCRMLKNESGEIISWTECKRKEEICEEFIRNESKYYSYLDTYQENVALFHRLMEYFKEKGITPIMVQFPGSKCGYEQACLQYKGQFYDTLNLFEEVPIHVLDFMGMDMFDESDCSDASHLSDEGAQKVTALIRDILENDIVTEG